MLWRACARLNIAAPFSLCVTDAAESKDSRAVSNMNLFYGTEEQFVDKILFPRCYDVRMKEKHIGRMCLENKRRGRDYKSRYKSMKSYHDKLADKVTWGTLTIHEYKFLMEHIWLVEAEEFIDKFGKERVTVELRKEITRARKLVGRSAPWWPRIRRINDSGRLERPSDFDEYGKPVA